MYGQGQRMKCYRAVSCNGIGKHVKQGIYRGILPVVEVGKVISKIAP